MFNLRIQYLDAHGNPVPTKAEAAMAQFGDNVRLGFDGRVWVRINDQWTERTGSPT